MLVNLAVGLLTTRVVLQTLGFVDFGIYGVVGGVVSMLIFINTSMSGATTRFLSFELGRCDEGRLQLTFSNAIIAHVIIAAVVFCHCRNGGLVVCCLQVGDSSRAHVGRPCGVSIEHFDGCRDHCAIAFHGCHFCP